MGSLTGHNHDNNVLIQKIKKFYVLIVVSKKNMNIIHKCLFSQGLKSPLKKVYLFFLCW